jgi:hypothetical protein
MRYLEVEVLYEGDLVEGAVVLSPAVFRSEGLPQLVVVVRRQGLYPATVHCVIRDG